MYETSALWAEIVRSGAGAVLATLWGVLWGSFGNVCISRIPRGESVVRPASHCPSCSSPIAWYDNIPLLSWILLRARCRRCQARIPARYVLVELLCAGLALLVFQRFAAQPASTPALLLARFVVYFSFAALLLVLSVIDLEHQILPDRITYPAIPALFLAGRLLHDVPTLDAAIGLAAGYLVVRLIADGYYYLTGREGLGYGDGKLLSMIGATLGWQALPVSLLVGSLTGLAVGVPVLLLRRRREGLAEPLRQVPLPFGPFLALGALLHLLLLHGRSETEILLRAARLLGLDGGGGGG